MPRPGTTKYGKNSLRYETARLWNTLPNEVRNFSLFDQIKNYILNGAVGKMFIVVPVNIKPCCFMHE